MKIKGMKWGSRKKFYTTIIKKDNALSGNPYVYGRIIGISEVIFEHEFCSYWHKDMNDGASYFTVFGKESDYEKFQEMIERIYPGLCDFDVKAKENDYE